MKKRIPLTCLSLLLAAAAACGEPIEPEKSAEALLDALQTRYTPTTVLGYRPTREKMFTQIDNTNGKILLVYTGDEFATTGIPDHNRVNTEHTWPQSRFKNGLCCKNGVLFDIVWVSHGSY